MQYLKYTMSFIQALFGCMCIHFNPHVLESNGMELSLIPLQSTSTHVDCDEYMRIQTRPQGFNESTHTKQVFLYNVRCVQPDQIYNAQTFLVCNKFQIVLTPKFGKLPLERKESSDSVIIIKRYLKMQDIFGDA